MATYPIPTLEAPQKKRSPFVALEGYATFYRMSDYTAGKLRSAMTPVGTYLFWQGFTLEDARTMLPSLQAFGGRSKILTACESVESRANFNAMLVQVGDDTSWFGPNHTPLLLFVDFLADPGVLPSNQKDDIKNANNMIEQTVVLKDLTCTASSISGSDANLVTWNLTFVGGELIYLAPTTMDLP